MGEEKVLKFLPNRVRRSYIGGSGIDRLRGLPDAVDSRFPEEWIASTVCAAANSVDGADAGLSRLAGVEPPYFRDYLAQYPEQTLGARHYARWGAQPGFLLKLLDSAIRLPVQAHPTPEYAQQHLHSPFGKNEAWLVVATRSVAGEEPYILLGFNEALRKETFIEESLAGELDVGLGMLQRIPVKPGDVFMLSAGMPHAIGPGLTVVEIMEPSDAIVMSERKCGDVVINDARRFNGLPPEVALDMYDFTPLATGELLAKATRTPKQEDEFYTTLIRREEEKYFGLARLQVRREYILDNRENIGWAGMVIEGRVQISGASLSAGETFFLMAQEARHVFQGNGEVILAQPPLA